MAQTSSTATGFRVHVAREVPWRVAGTMIDRRTGDSLALTSTDIAAGLVEDVVHVTPVLRAWERVGLATVADPRERPAAMPRLGRRGGKPYRILPPLANFVTRTRAMAGRPMHADEEDRYSLGGRMDALLKNPDVSGALAWIFAHPEAAYRADEIAAMAGLPAGPPGSSAIHSLFEHGLLERFGGRHTAITYAIPTQLRQILSIVPLSTASPQWTTQAAQEAVRVIRTVGELADTDHPVSHRLPRLLARRLSRRLETGIATQLNDERRLSVLKYVAAQTPGAGAGRPAFRRATYSSPASIATSLSLTTDDLDHPLGTLTKHRLLVLVGAKSGTRYTAPEGLAALVSAYEGVVRTIAQHERSLPGQ